MGSSQSTIYSFDLSNKVVIITGSTDGVGKSLARIISSYNPKRLILPIRNRKKGELLLEYIKESEDGNVECIELWDMDLADLHSVKNFADKFIKEVGELHYLWNNAGTLCFTGLVKTKDNFEQQFQVNHLSHFLLTSLLLPTIKNSATSESPCKIIHTSSSAQKLGKIDFDNLNAEKSCGYGGFYSDAKLMNIIYSNELNRRLKGSNVTSTACHPGFISTNLFQNSNLRNFIMFAKSPDIGAINVMYPALDANIDEGGKYFENCKEVKPNDQALDEDLAKKLWEQSEKLLNNYNASLLK
ncbi:26467_t:CDS:2 [Dentiscutata erythropus]|uniref:26467_t:CDS:1 n=1 Tax=Dentiscutata erythropus TaxID=1348616 RepID=A0A9N9CV30_9GLOM|nr:26467_t:CDS:2 [Dentiscutata erythropus]